MIIVGITGPIGHGKSTLAEFLASSDAKARIFESSEVISDVATSLNSFFKQADPQTDDISSMNNWIGYLADILAAQLSVQCSPDTFVIVAEQLAAQPREYDKLLEYIELVHRDPNLLETPITQDNKSGYRTLLQWIGGYCVTHLNRTIWNQELIRRAQHAGCSMAILGGIRFAEEAKNISKHGGLIVGIERSNTSVRDYDDPTERERSAIRVDTKVINDADLAALGKKSILLYQDIQTRSVQAAY